MNNIDKLDELRVRISNSFVAEAYRQELFTLLVEIERIRAEYVKAQATEHVAEAIAGFTNKFAYKSFH